MTVERYIDTKNWGLGYPNNESPTCYLFSHDEIFMTLAQPSRDTLYSVMNNTNDTPYVRLLCMARYAQHMPEVEKPLALSSRACSELHRVFNHYDGMFITALNSRVHEALATLVKHYPDIAHAHPALIRSLDSVGALPAVLPPAKLTLTPANPDAPVLNLLAQMFDASARLGSTVVINADHAAILNRLIRDSQEGTK